MTIVAGGPLYLDANVIVALHVQEARSGLVEELVHRTGGGLVVSDFGVAEASAAIGRKARMGLLAAEEASAAFLSIDRWVEAFTKLVAVEHADMRMANEFVRLWEAGLRAPDALHAAIAIRLSLELATLDVGLAKAARRFGVEVRDA